MVRLTDMEIRKLLSILRFVRHVIFGVVTIIYIGRKVYRRGRVTHYIAQGSVLLARPLVVSHALMAIHH